jgi:hypothetical protein
MPVGAIMAISNHAISKRCFDLVLTNLLQKTERKKLISIGEFVNIGQRASIRSVRFSILEFLPIETMMRLLTQTTMQNAGTTGKDKTTNMTGMNRKETEFSA